MVHRRPNLTRLAGLWLVLAVFLVSPLLAGQSFRFAFISDAHVGSHTGAEDLRATVQDINSLTGLSFVVLSGDVTEYGSFEQFRLAKEILDGLSIPLHLIPGNHDTKWSESGATDFARFWGDDRFSFESHGFRFIGLHQGPLMKMGDGHWAPQDVRWLEATLRKLPDTNQPIIFVTHYPIDDGIANWFTVLDLLQRFNTQAVLCGHGHSNRKLSFEGIPGTMGRSNLRARNPIGGYNLVDVQDGTMTFSERIPRRETRPLWRTITLGKKEPSTKEGSRPDYSVNQRYPQARPAWVVDTGYTIASTPAATDSAVIVGDASGKVRSIGLSDGRPVWSFQASNAVYSTPDLSGTTVVFASTDGCVYALDTASGRERWRFQTSRPIVASPRISGGLVYIGSSEGKFRALELDSGKLRWEFPGVTGFVETRPLVQDGKVIFGAWDQHLYALNARTGELDWKWRGDKVGALLSPAACWPIAAENKVFVVAPDRMMTALDFATGQQIWRTGKYVVRESIGLSEDRQRFYARDMNDRIYAFKTAAREPQLVWETDAKFGYDINSAMLVEKEGTVFYGTKNGLLLALDGKNGTVLWQHKFGTGVMNTVVPISAKSVVVTDFDGRVALITTK